MTEMRAIVRTLPRGSDGTGGRRPACLPKRRWRRRSNSSAAPTRPLRSTACRHSTTCPDTSHDATPCAQPVGHCSGRGVGAAACVVDGGPAAECDGAEWADLGGGWTDRVDQGDRGDTDLRSGEGCLAAGSVAAAAGGPRDAGDVSKSGGADRRVRHARRRFGRVFSGAVLRQQHRSLAEGAVAAASTRRRCRGGGRRQDRRRGWADRHPPAAGQPDRDLRRHGLARRQGHPGAW